MIRFRTITSLESALAAVTQDGLAIDYVPRQFRTEAVVQKAVEKNGYALLHVPLALRTESLMLKAVMQNGLVLAHIPEALRTEALVQKAVEQNHQALRLVTDLPMFIRIARRLGIETDQ